MRRLARSSIALFLALGFLLPAAWAAISRDEAVSVAQRMVTGRVLAVEHGIQMDNTVVWRIRMLTPAGDLRLVVIDAETGRVR
jgi:uncharacterized membrane protein YkoI